MRDSERKRRLDIRGTGVRDAARRQQRSVSDRHTLRCTASTTMDKAGRRTIAIRRALPRAPTCWGRGGYRKAPARWASSAACRSSADGASTIRHAPYSLTQQSVFTNAICSGVAALDRHQHRVGDEHRKTLRPRDGDIQPGSCCTGTRCIAAGSLRWRLPSRR